MRKHLSIVLFATASLFMAAQCAQRSPHATLFSTLKAAAAGIDSFRSDYEAARKAGQLSQEDFTRLDVAYNKANDAIIDVATAEKISIQLGQDAPTSEAVNEAVADLLQLIQKMVPSNFQKNSGKWKL